MAPLARVVHTLPGRERIKIEERRGDEDYFMALEKQLAGCPGVLAVEANFRTASVLIRHTVDDLQVWRYATEQGLFRIAEGESVRSAISPAFAAKAAPNAETAEGHVKPASRHDLGLRQLMFVGLVGVGIAQAIEGNIAVPAVAAFWYALNIFPRANGYSNVERGFADTESTERS
jgi:hypothetical protein